MASPRGTAYVRCTLETTRRHRRRGAGASGVNGGQQHPATLVGASPRDTGTVDPSPTNRCCP
jgi:hypothetical protein